MTQANMNIVLAAGGISVQGVISRAAEGQIGQEVSLPAADAGTLSTRTSDTAGTLTLGAGHGVTDRRAIRVERREVEPYVAIHVVDALPADCVRLALTELLDHRPDWVVSGINRGGNLGVDVFYSGTVAVAREAAFMGIPAVAVSQYVRAGIDEPDWDRATAWTRPVLEHLFAEPPDERPPIWNVNLPSLERSAEPRGRVVAPMALTPLQVRYGRPTDDAGTDVEAESYQFAGQYSERPAPAGTDVHYAFNGHVTLTPLSLDLTYGRAMPERQG